MVSQNDDTDHGSQFRQYLPDLSIPRFTAMQKQDAHEYATEFKNGGVPPWLHGLYLHWVNLLKEPFRGVTTDGKVRQDVYDLHDDGVDINKIASAALKVIEHANEEQRQRLSYHIDSPEWRTWSNPEFLLSDKGIRLDEVDEAMRKRIMTVLENTLSPEGYEKAISAMRINGFLGELVKSPRVCSELSYNFVIFGTPSEDRPWGFQFYGHHLCLNIFLYKSQINIAPWFTGAEPNLVDEGPFKGTRILETEEKLGLQLMQSLPKEKQAKAQIYKLMKDPTMPHGRWNHDDQRHLCGAYRDNRIVPYEGVLVSEMDTAQQALISGILEQYLLYLSHKARNNFLERARGWFKETYFCWIGGFEDHDPFYFRIQSPIILVEFDHHSGVFLTNKEPAKFHIHTLMRMPNGGDYGMALRPLIPGIEQKWVWDGER